MVALTQNRLNIISEITKDQFETRLKDESLTAQQIVNLTKERDLTLADLAEENRRRILDIDKNRYQNQIANLENFARRQQAVFDSHATVISGMGGFFNAESFSSRSVQAFFDTYLGGGIEKEIDRLTGRH